MSSPAAPTTQRGVILEMSSESHSPRLNKSKSKGKQPDFRQFTFKKMKSKETTYSSRAHSETPQNENIGNEGNDSLSFNSPQAGTFIILTSGLKILGPVLCLFCWCCMLAIISCITWLVVACWKLITWPVAACWKLITWPVVACWKIIRGVFMWLWRMCCKVLSVRCLCGRGPLRMMKAPGRGGKVRIHRAPFESNPASYFRGLRAR